MGQENLDEAKQVTMDNIQSTTQCLECGRETLGEFCPDHQEAGLAFDGVSRVQVRTLQILLQPFAFIEADYAEHGSTPSSEAILAHLCGETETIKLEELLARYNQIKNEIPKIVPNAPFFVSKIVEPLRQARKCYMIENWLACIALCGVVCEMLTMLVFEMHSQTMYINGKILNEKMQKAIFGKKFEKYSQEAKLNFLKALELINDEDFSNFNSVRTIRNNYIHSFSNNPSIEEQQKEAFECLKFTANLSEKVIGARAGKGGTISLPARLESYLIDEGLLEPLT